MTKSKTFTAALAVVLILLAVSAWLMFGRTAAGMGYPDADKYSVGNTTVTESVNSLYVDWTSGDVNIEYHDGTGVIVSETANRELSEDDRLRWWLDGDTLRIRFAKPGFRISVNLDKKLTVSLPKGTVLKSADIGTTSGDLFIPALAADEIRLDSTSGNIDAVTDAKTVTASSTSGDVKVSQKSALESVKLDSTSGTICPDFASVDKAAFHTTSGGVTGTVVSFKDLEAGSTSGSVNLKVGTEPGFTGRFSTTSGSFNTDLPLAKDGNQYTCGDGSARFVIDTTSGDITLGKLN